MNPALRPAVVMPSCASLSASGLLPCEIATAFWTGLFLRCRKFLPIRNQVDGGFGSFRPGVHQQSAIIRHAVPKLAETGRNTAASRCAPEASVMRASNVSEHFPKGKTWGSNEPRDAEF